jgi:hypothetical protein
MDRVAFPSVSAAKTPYLGRTFDNMLLLAVGTGDPYDRSIANPDHEVNRLRILRLCVLVCRWCARVEKGKGRGGSRIESSAGVPLMGGNWLERKHV